MEDPYDRAKRLFSGFETAVLAIADVSMRERYVAAALREHPIEDTAHALELLCQASEQADPEAREVLASVVQALVRKEMESFVQLLREEAAGRPLLALGRLLRKPLPKRDGASPNEPALPRAGRALTLGERKALARKPDRASFDKLFRDRDPSVIRTLLANPRLTEDDVVRLASRRPAVAEVIAEIAREARWSSRPRVRMAIVLNPGTPPELAVPMVGLLLHQELRLVFEMTELQPAVRTAAKEALERRPPNLGDDEEGPPN